MKTHHAHHARHVMTDKIVLCRWTAMFAALCVPCGVALAADLPSFVQNGKAGFVVSQIQYALGKDASETGVCPDGMTEGMGGLDGGFGQVGQRPAGGKAGAQQSAASNDDAARQYFRKLMDPNHPNACTSPEKFGPDPKFRTVKSLQARAPGIDLDGQDSRANGKAAPGTCSHDDVLGMNGEHGVDNEFYRLVGCSKAYQSTGQANTWTIEMYTGAWGILMTLSGVDDIRNDDDVEVGIYANADPIELSPNREPLPNATYAIEQDPRFRATTRGRIKDGVLTTDPVDVRIHKITNSIYLERTIRRARLRMTLSPDGTLDGILAGYTPVEDLYNFEFAFRNGKNGKGEPADPKLIKISALGRAAVLTYTCNGVYYAMQALADGDPDPATGKCTSISTQYHIKAIPAFVVDVKTKSENEDLR